MAGTGMISEVALWGGDPWLRSPLCRQKGTYH